MFETNLIHEPVNRRQGEVPDARDFLIPEH